MVEIPQFDFYSRKSEYVGDPLQMRQGPNGTDRRPLSVATGRIKAPPGPPLTVLLPEKTKRKMSCVTVAFLTCFL